MAEPVTNPTTPPTPTEPTTPTEPVTPTNPQTPTEPTNPQPTEPEKKFSQDDVDKIVADRLARDRAKFEKERKQAEELAKLSAEERARKEFDIKQQEFEEEKKQFFKDKLEVQTAKELNTKNLPSGLAKYLLGDDAKSTQDNIGEVEPILQEWLENALNIRLRGRTPERGGTVQDLSSNPYSDNGWNETAQGAIERVDPEKAKALKAQVLADPSQAVFKRYQK